MRTSKGSFCERNGLGNKYLVRPQFSDSSAALWHFRSFSFVTFCLVPFSNSTRFRTGLGEKSRHGFPEKRQRMNAHKVQMLPSDRTVKGRFWPMGVRKTCPKYSKGGVREKV